MPGQLRCETYRCRPDIIAAKCAPPAVPLPATCRSELLIQESVVKPSRRHPGCFQGAPAPHSPGCAPQLVKWPACGWGGGRTQDAVKMPMFNKGLFRDREYSHRPCACQARILSSHRPVAPDRPCGQGDVDHIPHWRQVTQLSDSGSLIRVPVKRKTSR